MRPGATKRPERSGAAAAAAAAEVDAADAAAGGAAIALPEGDFAPETAESRFLRHRTGGGTGNGGGSGPDFGSNGAAAAPYSLAEGVWRPDGRGANETIYAPFEWKGRKVRALRPEPRFARGEQYAAPAAENPDDYIGALTGDARFSGDQALVSKGARPDRFNRFAHLQLHAKNGGQAGAAGEALFGVGEAQVARASRRDQALALLSSDGGTPQVARPRRLLQRAAEDLTAGALEALVGEDRAREFLLDPEANEAYNTLGMGGFLTPVNATGDMNLAADEDFAPERGRMALAVPSGSSARAGRRADAVVGDTMNAVKVRDADLRGVNGRGYADPGDRDEGEGGPVDALAVEARQGVRDGRLTTDALYGVRGADVFLSGADGGAAADQEAPSLSAARRFRRKEQDRGSAHGVIGGGEDEHAPRDMAILAHSRRQRVKEQERGGAHAALGGGEDEHAPRDAAILAHSRRQRVKEQERGGAHAALGGGEDEHAPRDAAILAHSRRQRVKEQARGGAHGVMGGGEDEHAPRDAAILAHSRRQRRKEQDRGGAHGVIGGGEDEHAPRDMAILAHSRRYRRKEQEGFAAAANTGNLHSADPLDWQVRFAAPRAREASTMKRLDGALNPGAGNGEERDAEQGIVAEVPAQASRAQRRAGQRAEFGVAGTRAPEFTQYAAQSALDPHGPELLTRATQMAKTRDRRREQTQIAARGYDESEALRDAYREDSMWIARGRGKLGQPALYESGDESGAE